MAAFTQEQLARVRELERTARPEHIYGSYSHRKLCEVAEEARTERKLREDFEALATCAWELLKKLDEGLVGFDKLVGDDMETYLILVDYFEEEGDER